MVMPVLPIFPMGTIVVPGQRMTLRLEELPHIVLLRDLLRKRTSGHSPQFGTLAVPPGSEDDLTAPIRLYDVGCAVTVIDVEDRGDGSYEVLLIGTRRFRLDSLDEGSRTPYQVGFVTWLRDRCGDAESVRTLSKRLVQAIGTYRKTLGLKAVSLSSDPVSLSFLAGTHVVLERADRHRLLACPDVESRLRMTLSMTRRETVLQRELGAFPGRYVPAEPAAN